MMRRRRRNPFLRPVELSEDQDGDDYEYGEFFFHVCKCVAVGTSLSFQQNAKGEVSTYTPVWIVILGGTNEVKKVCLQKEGLHFTSLIHTSNFREIIIEVKIISKLKISQSKYFVHTVRITKVYTILLMFVNYKSTGNMHENLKLKTIEVAW